MGNQNGKENWALQSISRRLDLKKHDYRSYQVLISQKYIVDTLRQLSKAVGTWDLDVGMPMFWEVVMEKFMLWKVLKLVVWVEPIRSKRSDDGAVDAGTGTGAGATCRPEKRSIPAGLTGWAAGMAGWVAGKAFQSPKSPFPLDAGAEERQKLLMKWYTETHKIIESTGNIEGSFLITIHICAITAQTPQSCFMSGFIIQQKMSICM